MVDRTKKTLVRINETLIIAMAVFVCLNATTNASSKKGHDFLTMPGDPLGKSCFVCHLPDEVPGSVNTGLRQTAAGTPSNTMYTTYTTMAGNKGDLSGNSKLCLSCHDGTTAMDSMVQNGAQSMKIGTDLSDDHPVGVAYPPTKSNGQLLPNYRRVPNSGVRLFGSANNRVECASCHDPHGNENEKMLRVSNRGSNLCLSCHDL